MITDQIVPRCLLVTGGAGFIGSNFIRWVLANQPQVTVINLDLLTYAGNLENLADVASEHGPRGDNRYRFVKGDIRDYSLVSRLLRGAVNATDQAGSRTPEPDAMIHFAAESHVDRSILGPAVFIEVNVQGTLNLLDACRAELAERPRPFRFIHISTDEVYGSLALDDPAFTEESPLAPNSPYAASKAGSDLLVRSYVNTFGLPAVTTRCSNNYGPHQFPEKLIPLMITRAIEDKQLPVYGDGKHVRDWIHVSDHVEALWAVMERGRVGRTYNIGGGVEVGNLEVVLRILRLLGKPESLICYVTDRPGHDRRYGMDISRIRSELGWSPRFRFEEALAATVTWYLEHRTWWERVASEAYRTASALYLVDA